MKSNRPIILLIFIFTIFAGKLFAQTGSVFYVPDTTIVAINDSCQIDIAVNSNLTGIHCYIVSIGFDTLLVELTEVIEGPLLPDNGPTFFHWNENNGGYDILSCLLGHGLFADGPGVLATMKFRTFADTGTSSLHFTSQEFTDTLNSQISVLPLYGAIIVEDTLSSVYDDDVTGIPDRLGIIQIYPNPFNSRTFINYFLSVPGFVEIEIYDLMGRLRDVLVAAEIPAGHHKITWNAEDMESGVYFARMNFGGFSDTRKMILIK